MINNLHLKIDNETIIIYYINKMSISNEFQEENYNIKKKSKKLKDMLGKIKEIKEKMQENIDKLNKNLESLEMAINNYILWLVSIAPDNLDSNNNMNQNEFNEEIKKKSKLFFDSVINIYYSKNLNIIDSRKKFYDLFDEFIKDNFSPNENGFLIHFNPNKNNNFSQNFDNQDFSQNRSDFYNALNEQNTLKDNSISIDGSIADKCCQCNLNKASCSYLNVKYCEECINELINKLFNEGKTPNLDDIIYFNNKKDLFMNSFEALIKIILLKYNYILNNENQISINMENHMGKNIKRKLNYPIMKSEENNDLNLMKDINSLLINDFSADFQNFSETNYGSINLNNLIKESVRKIFKDKKIFDDNIINKTEENYMMEDDSAEYDNNMNDNFDINLAEVKNENFVKKDKKNKALKDYYLLINLISKKKESYNVNLEIEVIKSFNNYFTLNKEQILFSYNRSYFIDNLLRTEKFNNLSLSEVKNNYQYFDELYEFKYIIDELLIRQCKIDKNLIDYKGHFIIPNKSNNLIRGKEKYYPPYGWIGIGLKALEKYNDGDDWINDSSKESKWSIAYHGVGGNLPSSEVIKKLNKKIINGLKDGESQYKCNYSDIRHKNKKIGTGVYLTPNINIAENYSGEIKFNNSKYKIALMVRVLNEKIREPEDINFWILHKRYIRIYRILLKKINE